MFSAAFLHACGGEYAHRGKDLAAPGTHAHDASRNACRRGLFCARPLYIACKEAHHLSAIARLSLLYVHVVAFAVALGCVLREDAKLVSRWPLDPRSLREASRIVATALAVLWASG